MYTKLDAEFSFAVRLGMLHYSLWEMPVRRRTITRNLNGYPSTADTFDITNNSECPDLISNTFQSPQQWTPCYILCVADTLLGLNGIIAIQTHSYCRHFGEKFAESDSLVYKQIARRTSKG